MPRETQKLRLITRPSSQGQKEIKHGELATASWNSSWTAFSGSVQGAVVDFCEYGSETSDSIKSGRDFLRS
jgi:hypothetical protein